MNLIRQIKEALIVEELTRFPINLINPIEREESANRQNTVPDNGSLPA
jgi:hypothetical protein